MSSYAHVLVGEVGGDDVADVVGRALAALEISPSGRSFRLSDSATVELDDEPFDPLDDEPELRGITHHLEIFDRAPAGDDGLDAQRLTARRVYDALVAATRWKVVLITGEWGGVAAVREAVPTAA